MPFANWLAKALWSVGLAPARRERRCLNFALTPGGDQPRTLRRD